MKYLKNLLCGVGLFVLLFAAYIAYLHYLQPREKKTEGDKLQSKIAAFALDDPHWQVPISKEMQELVNDAVKEPLTFLGKGKQCMAFATYDGKYVFKFLLRKPLIVKPRFRNLPDYFPYTLIKDYKVQKREERIQNLYSSFLVSYNTIPDQTGIICVHLNGTKNLFRRIMCIDDDGNPCEFDLDSTQFVVQKRARHVKNVIVELMWHQKVDEAKRCIDQIFQMLYTTAKKGVLDVDQGLIRNNNIGLLDDGAIYIDTGKLRASTKIQKKRAFIADLKRIKPLNVWLKRNYPELANYFEKRQKEIIAAY